MRCGMEVVVWFGGGGERGEREGRRERERFGLLFRFSFSSWFRFASVCFLFTMLFLLFYHPSRPSG